ncbi:MAG: cobalt ECF transporter T component CbiQ [Dehalococcoidales bacterium]|nr:cobalt ECF transporter T component CbiQ [Dehalococcoidales bacterium]
MKHSFLDQYSDRDSPLHRLDPRSKLVATLAFIIAVVLTPVDSWPAYGMYLVLLAVLIVLSRVPPLYILRRSLVIVPFVLLVAVLIPFFKGGEVAGSYNIGMWHISVSQSGLQIFWNILARAWLSIISLSILAATTRFASLLEGLERLRFPRVLVMLLSFMYRYIFILTDEVMRMKQARDSRSFGGKWRWQIKTVGNMVGTLFLRSYERGERVYAAMVARGFDGHSRTLERLRFGRRDALFAAGLSLALVAINLFNLLY